MGTETITTPQDLAVASRIPARPWVNLARPASVTHS